MSYLDRLKQLENGEIFHNTPGCEPTEPTKGAFDGFVGSIPGAYGKIHAENDADETGNIEPLNLKKCAYPLPTEPSKGIEYWHWRIQFPDRYPLEVYFNPDADHAEVMRRYPTATDLEPIPEPPRPMLSPSGLWHFTPAE